MDSLKRKTKVILIGLTYLFLCSPLLSQSPGKFSYQAVVRNADGTLITNQSVGIRIQILQTSEFGAAAYVETHTRSTNANGLVTLEIGGGDVVLGSFSEIKWAAGPFFLKTEIDPAGGTSYSINGTTQILSVPYALYADDIPNLDWSRITTGKPTTLTGYGITDGVNTTGPQTVGGTKTFLAQIYANNGINANSKNITNVADPTSAQHAATKAYVDKLLSAIQTIQVGVRDADGNSYKVILIGDQIWMAENLKSTKYNDGTNIPLVTDNTAWGNLNTPGYCLPYNNSTNGETYGALYNWHTVNSGKLCPSGWHVPTDADWSTFSNYLISNGYSFDGFMATTKIGKSLASTNLWNASTIVGAVGNTDFPEIRNATGFTGLPAGSRTNTGTFQSIGNAAVWWSATETDATNAKRWYLLNMSPALITTSIEKKYGHSVRCIKD